MFYQNRESAFRILGVFYVERARREIFERDRRHTALSYRLVGSSIFRDEKGEQHAGSGAVTYIPAGCDYHHLNHEREQIIILHLECFGAAEHGLQVLSGCGFVEPLFRQLLAAWESGQVGAYAAAMSIFYRILEELGRKHAQDGVSLPSVIAPGVAMLRDDFRNSGLTVGALAERCFVSEVYFRRLFHAHFGCSPLQMMLQLRFDYAVRLLSSGYYTPKQVAVLSGFSDVKYFRTAFQKRFGRTPSSVIPQTHFEKNTDIS